jgi:hypothetical protein
MNECRRRGELGRYGETAVCELLAGNGWHNCHHIGGTNPYFDITADKNGQKFFVSVKTRNHNTDKGVLKTDGYNFLYSNLKGGDPDAKVKAAEGIARAHNATFMWAAVTVDVAQQMRLRVCHGLVADLLNKKVIPMSPSDIIAHQKLGPQNVFDPRIDTMWSNRRRH